MQINQICLMVPSRILLYKYFNFHLLIFSLFCSFNGLNSLTQNGAIIKVTFLGKSNNNDVISKPWGMTIKYSLNQLLFACFYNNFEGLEDTSPILKYISTPNSHLFLHVCFPME